MHVQRSDFDLFVITVLSRYQAFIHLFSGGRQLTDDESHLFEGIDEFVAWPDSSIIFSPSVRMVRFVKCTMLFVSSSGFCFVCAC
jgi:hypothetical protein